MIERRWLNVPEAVCLLLTGELVELTAADDPHVLELQANRYLERKRIARQVGAATPEQLKKILDHQTGEQDLQRLDERQAHNIYAEGGDLLRRRLLSAAAAEDSVQARKAQNGPIGFINPAEFAFLQFSHLDAIDPRTGKTIRFDVLIATDLVRKMRAELRSVDDAVATDGARPVSGGIARQASARRGRPPAAREAAKNRMLNSIQTGDCTWERLAGTNIDALAAEFKTSRDTARRARNDLKTAQNNA